jgi:hypothetical protein
MVSLTNFLLASFSLNSNFISQVFIILNFNGISS